MLKRLFSFLRRPYMQVIEPPRKSSLFSTEMPDGKRYEEFAFADLIANAIPITPKNFVARDGKGAVITMDKLPDTMKGGTSIAKYAMDAPTIGNPLSMKPGYSPMESIPFAQLSWYAAQTFCGYQVAALIAQHWLIDKVCTMPAEDAIRHGYEIATEDDDEIDGDVKKKVLAFMKKRDKAFRIKHQCTQLIKYKRVFGIRIAMFIIDSKDKDFYTKPFNLDAVKPGSYKGISQIDPYWITPELDSEAAANPASPDFYEPTWWRINGQRIHRTHLIVVRNGDVADLLKPSYLYGGIPIPQKIAERVYAAERTANEAPQLALTKRTTIMKMDMEAAVANQTQFDAIMAFFARTRDNYGVKTIGLTDEAEQFDISLSDFSDTIMTQYQLVAAGGGVMASKLLEDSPKGGLGSEGQYNERGYHESLESMQEHDAQPLVERHHQLLMMSEIKPKFGVTFDAVVVWNSTETKSEKERAEINKLDADTAKVWADIGAIDGADGRSKLIADKDSGWNSLDDVVPGGPSDPDFVPTTQRRMTIREGDGMDNSLISGQTFNPATGMLGDAQLITSQEFLNDDKVNEKIQKADFHVNVSPVFERGGRKYRMLVDGHHSLAAACRSHQHPIFHETGEDMINPVTRAKVGEL